MYNVLICDDQPDIVNALKIYLTPEGYRLFEAYNGQEALQIVREAGADPAGMTYEEKQKLQAKIVRRLASRGFSGGVCYRAARETVK